MIPENFHMMPRKERLDWLKANADSTERDQNVFKDLNPSEIDDLEGQIATDSVELSKIEQEKKEVLASFKERMDPIKNDLKINIQSLRTGQEEVVTDIFYIADYDNNRMYGYAPDGTEVRNRRLRSDEMQISIHSINRAN